MTLQHQLNFWPTSAADVSDLYPFFEELKSLSPNYTIISNTTSASMFPTISAAVGKFLGPLYEPSIQYGASYQLSSRLIPQSCIDPSNHSSIAAVSQAIWKGLQIVNEPLGSNGDGLFGSVPVVMLGYMPAATAKLVNNTGANPGMYSAAWHVMYSV